jgi:hypothetical protein
MRHKMAAFGGEGAGGALYREHQVQVLLFKEHEVLTVL